LGELGLVNGYKVVGVIAIALALVAIASVVVILLNFTSSGSLRVEVSSRIAHLNVTAKRVSLSWLTYTSMICSLIWKMGDRGFS